MRRLWLFLLSLVLVISIGFVTSSCGKKIKVTNVPVGVPEQRVVNWFAAVGALEDATSVTDAAKTAVIQLNKTVGPDGNPILPDGSAYAGILTSVGKALQLEGEAARFLKTVPKTWDESTQTKLLSWIDPILAELQNINTLGVTGIKNPQSLQRINGFITQIRMSIQLIRGLITIVTSHELNLPFYPVAVLSRGEVIYCVA